MSRLRAYKHGCGSMGLESPRYALPGLRWLGLRVAMLGDVEARHLQPLTPRDRAMITNLTEALRRQHESAAAAAVCSSGAGGFHSCASAAAACTAAAAASSSAALSWCSELEQMASSGFKADIEALYSVCGGFAGLAPLLAQAILRRAYD